MKKELEGTQFEVDPRIIHTDSWYEERCNWEITHEHDYKNGKTIITITKEYFGCAYDDDSIEDDEQKEEGWEDTHYIRVYDSTKEVVPRFDSDTYNYLGLKNECAP